MGDAAPVEAILLRRSYVLRDVGIALALIGWLATLPNDGSFRVFWFVFLGMTGLVLAILGGEGTPRSTAASLDAEGVHAGGKLIVPRSRFIAAWIERDPEGIRVQLDAGGHRGMQLAASTDEEARSFLRAMRLDPSQTALRFRPASPFAAIWGSIGGQLFAHSLIVGGHHQRFFLPFAISSMSFVLLWLAFVEELRIGSDGILFAGTLRRRFVPFADVIGAATDDRGLVVHTKTYGTFVRRMRSPAAEAAAERIERAVGTLGSSVHARPDPVRRQLRREGDIGAWVARLRSLATPAASYRAAGVAGDALWRVVDDPGATSSERAAAAVVLGAGATPEERARLLDAAARIVSPRVRVAMERAADPVDEEELVGALAALDETLDETDDPAA
jgi:hypothetical protein